MVQLPPRTIVYGEERLANNLGIGSFGLPPRGRTVAPRKWRYPWTRPGMDANLACSGDKVVEEEINDVTGKLVDAVLVDVMYTLCLSNMS